MSFPPDDTDSRVDAVLERVAEAIRALGLGDPSLERDVLGGIRSALDELGREGLGHRNARVVVFEPPEESEEMAPGLRVVDTEEAERFSVDDGVRVRVVRSPAASGAAVPLAAEGAIRTRWIDGERPWQTVYRGEAARAYRLGCETGSLELSVDGASVERMTPGQTVDVEARVVRVRAAAHADATGRYVRLA